MPEMRMGPSGIEFLHSSVSLVPPLLFYRQSASLIPGAGAYFVFSKIFLG